MFRESIFKGLTRKESEDLINAVKHDKYWKIDPASRDFICVVALSRARVRSRRGRYAKATFFKRIEVSTEAAEFCRKWRILLVDARVKLAVSVMTWSAFNKIVSTGLGPVVCSMFKHGKPPPYFNIATIHKIRKISA